MINPELKNDQNTVGTLYKKNKRSYLDLSIDWALDNKFWVLVATSIFMFLTILKLDELAVDAVPDITNVQVVINTKTKGLDPEKVELTVTQPIEFEMMGLPELHDMRSISKFGLSQVSLIFKDGTDIYWARQLVTEKLQSAKNLLPSNLQPEMAPISTGLGEVFMYSVDFKTNSPWNEKSKKEQLLYLREVQDYQIRPALRKIKDVADVDTGGGFKKELHINLNPFSLIQNGKTINDVQLKLLGLGESYGGGTVVQNNNALIVRTSSYLNDISSFEDISIAQKFNGQQLFLKDVASVSFDSAPRLGGATFNGKETVLGTILMQSGGNGRSVSNDVDKAIDKLVDEKILSEDVQIHKLYSRGYLVNATLKTVIKNLAEGAILVVVILLLLLGNFRAALIVSVVIPLSMLGTTLGMQFFKISGNLMSLGAIDFGLVVDGAVVLVETLLTSFYGLSVEEKNKFSKDQIVSFQAKKVMRPVVFGLMMIMLVYLPILLLEGIEGKMFKPMAYTVLMTLGWSLLFTVFLIPVLVSLFIKIPDHSQAEAHETYFFKKIKSLYQPILVKFVAKPKFIIISISFLAIVSLIMFLNLGADFIPQLDEGDMVVNITRNSKISLEESIREQELIEKKIAKLDEVEFVFSRLGTPESATDPMGVHLADTFIILKKNKKDWSVTTKEELFFKIRNEIQSLGFEQEISSNQPIEMRFNEMLEGSRADVSLRVVGSDLNYLVEAINDYESKVKNISGLEESEMDPLTALRKSQVIDINPVFSQLAKYNISLQEFNNTVVSFMGGLQIGQWIEGTRSFSIVLHLSEDLRDNLEQIKNIPIPLPDGESVPLSVIAKIEIVSKVTTIARSWGQRYAALSLNIMNRDTMSFVNDLKSVIAKNPVRSDHRLHLGGQFNNLTRAKNRLLLIIPFTMLLIIFILWREFSSIKDALLIFLCVPLATFGGIIGIYIRDIHLSLSAAVGFIALIGIALLNGIVLLTVFNQLKDSDDSLSIKEIVLIGTVSRLRPVVMTALVASLGFIPMAINTGLGSEVQKPLATVVISGIIFSTFININCIPDFLLVDSFKK